MAKKFKKHKQKSGQGFWDSEYQSPEHLAISDKPSENLEKFLRWLNRNVAEYTLDKNSLVGDVGCGNGRNLIYLAQNWAVCGVGYDISASAVEQAQSIARSESLDLDFSVRDIREKIPLEDASADLILDMMVSHVLSSKEREAYLEDVLRVLKPGGWLFFKTFLLDGDRNAAEMLKQYPGSEPGSYIHPHIGVEEHVFTENEVVGLYESFFEIHKVNKSHRHIDRHGRPNKRRTINLYCRKPEF